MKIYQRLNIIASHEILWKGFACDAYFENIPAVYWEVKPYRMPEVDTLSHVWVEKHEIKSYWLDRWVRVDCYYPRNIAQHANISLLLFNDGQDLLKMEFASIFNHLLAQSLLRPVICSGIHCGPDRKMEYGTASQPDYMGRGARASLYQSFVLLELLPFLRLKYARHQIFDLAFAGFSLGGLSALDIVWHNSHYFSKVGVFSGSLWWRQKAYEDGYDNDKDRIMLNLIRNGHRNPRLRFFFQCGLLDETADRNNNGIIDAVEDTRDVVEALKAKGYPDDHIFYFEMPDGKHDVATWARAMPYLLRWGWGAL